jgi:hypothetical protein
MLTWFFQTITENYKLKHKLKLQPTAVYSDGRADPFLGGPINKWLHIIPRANQGLENLHIVKVNHLEEFNKPF